MSTAIFNIVLTHAIVSINKGRYIFSRFTIICAYEDDIALTSQSMRKLEENFLTLESKTKKLGMLINKYKTKYICISSNL